MQWMKEQAELRSGVKHDEAQNVSDLYEKIGHDTFYELSRRFYDRVYDDEQWFKDIFAGRPKEEAIRNQSEFFMQRMGGPSLYSDRKGQQTLISRHKSWRVDQAAAERWLFHMEETIKSLDFDDDTRDRLLKFFRHTAFLLVAAKEVMAKKKEQQPSEVLPTGKDIILQPCMSSDSQPAAGGSPAMES